MSRTTREINRITTTIISMSVRLLFYALVFFLLYEGHEVFSPTAVAEAPGTDKEFTIRNGESLSEVAEELEKSGLINNKLIFIIQAKFFDYEVYPGTYTLNTSMTSRDMMKAIDESGIERKKAAESSAAASTSSGSSGESGTAGSSAENIGSDESGETTGENGASREDGAADEDGAYVS